MIFKEIKIQTYIDDPTNCYIIMDENTKETMVVDPAGEVNKIIDMINILKANVKYIYITHCHFDHIGAENELKQQCGGKILIHRFEAENLNNPNVNLSGVVGMQEIELEADSRVDDGDLIHIGDTEFVVIHTPGHTSGGTCLYCQKENLLISGDTLFRGTWGRTDLPTSSFEQIINSITTKLMKLPEETIVYPGHGKSTMIKDERPIYFDLKPKLI